MSNFQHYMEMAVNFKETDKRKNLTGGVAKALTSLLKKRSVEVNFLKNDGNYATSKKKVKMVFVVEDPSDSGVVKSIIETFGKEHKDFDFDVDITKYDAGDKFTVVIKKLEEPKKDNVDISDKS